MSGWTPSVFVDDTTPPALSAAFFNGLQDAVAAGLYGERLINIGGIFANEVVYTDYTLVRMNQGGAVEPAASVVYYADELSDIVSVHLLAYLGVDGVAGDKTYVQLVGTGYPTGVPSSEIYIEHPGGATGLYSAAVLSPALSLVDLGYYGVEIKGIETSYIFDARLVFFRNPAS